MAPLGPEEIPLPRHRPPLWLALALVAAADFGLTHLGLALSPGKGSLALFWPASGLMLGVLLLSPPRRWPAFLLAGAVPIAAFNAATGQPPFLIAAFQVANALEALLGAAIAVRLCRGRPDLTRIGHMSALLVAGPVVASGAACLLSAVAVALAGGQSGFERFAISFFGLWMGSGLGTMAIAPILLAWAEPPRSRVDGRLALEVLALVAVFVFVAWILFVPEDRLLPLPLSLFLPLLLWCTLRFGLRGATASGFLLAMTVQWATARGLGRFALGEVELRMVGSQIYSAVTLFSLLGMAGVVEARRRGAEALRRSEQRLRLVSFATNSVSDPLVCLDPAGTLVYVNDAAATFARRDPRTLVGQQLWAVLPNSDESTWRRHWEGVKRLGTLTAELPAAGIESHVVPFEVRSSYLCFDGQEYCVSAARDLRDRRQAEAALRLASIGTMAAGMAHEINNPLAYVLGNLEWISQQVRRAREDGGEGVTAPAVPVLAAIGPALEETIQGANRIRKVVRDVKLFSRAPEGSPLTTSADVVRALRGAVTLAQHEIRHRARLTQEYEQLPPVAGDENRLGQVFLNLILNAAQSIPEGYQADNLVRVEARRGAGQEVVVEVEDTGCGMSAEVLARIFDPFFTTKPVGLGTGLGLSICHGIVASVGGKIEASSHPGCGSLFRVRLPLSGDQASSTAELAPESAG